MQMSLWKAGDEFPLLDLVAQLRFRSASSLSFDLGTKGNSLSIPGEKPWVLDEGRVFTVIGWLDVHYPCDAFHRLHLRVGLPDRYVCFESMRAFVVQLKAVIGLPSDESFHIYMAGLSKQTSTEEPQEGI